MKGRSILESILVFCLLQIILFIPFGVRNLVHWENRTLGGSYFTGALMVALSIFMIISRGHDFRDMGITGDNWRKSFNYGIRGWWFFIIPQYILTIILGMGASYSESLEIAGLLGGLIILLSFLMTRRSEVEPATNKRLYLIAALLIFPIIIKYLYDEVSWRLLKRFIWNILVGSFAEEFFYRGFIQSTINLEFKRNWKFGKIRFGPGLLVSSLLYGLSRGLRTIKPWRGIYQISWSWTLFTFSVGFFYGLIRESSGDIIGSFAANSLIDAIGETLVG